MRRIKDVNPVLNAVVEERFKAARNEAKLVDSYLKTTSLTNKELEKIKPLLGVPITVKECCSVMGNSLTIIFLKYLNKRDFRHEFKCRSEK